MRTKFLSFAFFFTVCGFAAEVVLTTPVETDLLVPQVEDTQKSWIKMISAARETLDIEQFYIADEKGESLEPVLAAIRKAAEKGVKVRVLGDNKFFKTYPATIKELGNLANIEARTIDYGAGVQHAKFFIVDGKSFYIGSANFDWRALKHIHELGLRVDDVDLATSLGAVFDTDWAKGVTVGSTTLPSRAARKVVNSGKSGDLHLVGSPESELPEGLDFSLPQIIALLQQAKTAKDTVDIQTMEYSTKAFGSKTYAKSGPWNDLDDELRAAAGRGAKVRLLVENKSAQKATKELKALAKVKNIEVRTVEIPEAKQGHIDYARLIHSKYLVVNGSKAWVGTDNWSRNYFTQSRGVGLITDSASTVSTLSAVYQKLWESPYATKVK